MEIIVDAFLDALIDGVKMLPFLYLAYLLIATMASELKKRWLAAATGALCPAHCWAAYHSAGFRR